MIIVTGSGRSGTSFVTKALSIAGAQFPDSTPYDDTVRAGLENTDIVNLNKTIYSMNGAYDYYGVSWIRPDQEDTTAQILGSALRLSSDRYDGIFVKDPLFSKTIGVWAKANVNIEHVIICMRNVYDTVQSAMNTKRGFESSIEHSQEAIYREIYARIGYLMQFVHYHDIPYTVVHYERLSKELMSLSDTLSLNSNELMEFLTTNYQPKFYEQQNG